MAVFLLYNSKEGADILHKYMGFKAIPFKNELNLSQMTFLIDERLHSEHGKVFRCDI
jgi:hypothetical protein